MDICQQIIPILFRPFTDQRIWEQAKITATDEKSREIFASGNATTERNHPEAQVRFFLSRDGVPSIFDGVPFTAILTITDPQKEAPVNVDMKAQMQAVGIQLSNIQVEVCR